MPPQKDDWKHTDVHRQVRNLRRSWSRSTNGSWLRPTAFTGLSGTCATIPYMTETGDRHVIEHLEAQGRFRLSVDGAEAVVLDYVDRAEVGGDQVRRDILHTYSDPRFRGTGVASELVQYVFDDARVHGLKIVPSCPYIPVWVSRHPSENDLIA
jgi:predicted GNAT family acetyltransferase